MFSFFIPWLVISLKCYTAFHQKSGTSSCPIATLHNSHNSLGTTQPVKKHFKQYLYRTSGHENFWKPGKKRSPLLVTFLLWKVSIFASNIWYTKIMKIFIILLQPDSLDLKFWCRRFSCLEIFSNFWNKKLLLKLKCSSWESINENFTKKN